ncbi:GNAT family N-acetyltransferase [Streptomyces pactum]|uniref:GNAT family N-acetyltransferase n=1 Tax=Streptomyces pactum TaxID=68249 RepID=A0ABS0NL25_9ACTN|nr:GNAT family N-acetyltransferase [Streptomyces pactum]MBH5335909.1 GNAT family N-acetyltransferase [Streptomyces pactum]
MGSERYRIEIHPLTGYLRDRNPGWHTLHRADPDATPFHHPDWIAAWWTVFAPSFEDAVVLSAHSGHDPVAVLPLALSRGADGELTACCAGNRLTDYCGWVADPRADHAGLLREMLTALAGSGVSAAHLWDVPAHSAMGRALHAAGPDARVTAEGGDVCPVVTFPRRWEDYWAARGRNLRGLVRKARRLESAAGPAATVLTSDPGPGRLKSFIDLHLAWWRSRGRDSLLEYPTAQDLLTALAERFRGTGNLLLSEQRCAGDVTAMFLLAEDGKARYYYQSALNPEFAHLHPGIVHMHDVARLTYDSGFSRFDLLRGEERYKVQFANQMSRNMNVVISLS